MDFNKIIVSEELNIREALQILDRTAKKVIFVVNGKKLVGAVSDGDVRRWIIKNGSLEESVQALMNRQPIYIDENNREKAYDILRNNKITAIPLVNKRMEIIKIFFIDEDEEHVKKKITNRVIIMAGGKGERLLPYTSVVPKPLIPIEGKPILEHIIDGFKKFGCSEFSLALNYKKSMIKAYFDDIEKDYSIEYIEEDKPLGTGGALGFLKGKEDKTFFVSNCDIMIRADYSDIYKKHKHDGNQITIVSSLKQFTIPYGVISIGEMGHVNGLMEKPKSDYLVNTGFYVLEPSVLDQIHENEFIHITDLIEKCIENGLKVGTYPIGEEAWLDMGQFEGMEEMKRMLVKECF